jgi:hypothetical protein
VSDLERDLRDLNFNKLSLDEQLSLDGKHVMIPCFCVTDSSSKSDPTFIEFTTNDFKFIQKNLKNSVEKPSDPGDLLLFIFCKTLLASFTFISPSKLNCSSKDNLLKFKSFRDKIERDLLKDIDTLECNVNQASIQLLENKKQDLENIRKEKIKLFLFSCSLNKK